MTDDDILGGRHTQVWSCGGGVQSAAIAALIIQGRLPVPDMAVIVDTEREKSSTWRYLEDVLRPALAPLGLEIHRVAKSDHEKTDLFGEWDGADGAPIIPAFVGGGGRLRGFCSSRWKRRVVQRWLRRRGVALAEVWLGISTDEIRRSKLSGEKWFEHYYPLIDQRVNRADCYALISRQGWPIPDPSSCWCCPNIPVQEWRRMRQDAPADFAAAVALEQDLQRRRPDIYLSSACRPLDHRDFGEGQGELFATCDSGFCFT